MVTIKEPRPIPPVPPLPPIKCGVCGAPANGQSWRWGIVVCERCK